MLGFGEPCEKKAKCDQQKIYNEKRQEKPQLSLNFKFVFCKDEKMRATNERFMRLCNITNLQPGRTNADLLSVAITLTALQIFRCLESLTPISQILKSF